MAELLTKEQLAEIERRLEVRREWERGVQDCEWCGQRGADLNRHRCFIAAEASAEYAVERFRQRAIEAVRAKAANCNGMFSSLPDAVLQSFAQVIITKLESLPASEQEEQKK